MPTVLISHLYERQRVDALRERFPAVRFLHLPSAPPWPEGTDEGEALLFAGLRKPELSGLLRAAAAVRWIHTGSAGFDWVEVPEVEERGIVVTRSADVMSIPMAEFAFAAILAHVKNLEALRDSQRRRAWEPPMHAELHGRTLLVVGAGSIGARVAGLARAFGMRVLGIKRDGAPRPGFDAMYRPDRLDEVLPEADVVVLTAPATPETEGMIDAGRLKAMKRDAYLVNIARGALVVEDDLLDALRSGEIAGACLDAFAVEPLPADHPLWSAPNTFISPHASYRSPAIRQRVFEEFSENLERWLASEPLANTKKHPALGY